jgi:hypothetical protein
MSYDLRGNNPPYEDQAPNSCNARIHPTGANAWPFNGHFVSPRFIVKTNPSFCNVTTDTHYYYWRGTDINGWHQEPWCGCSMGDLYRSSSMDNAVMGQPPGYCEQSTTVCDPNGQNCWSGPAMRYSFTEYIQVVDGSGNPCSGCSGSPPVGTTEIHKYLKGVGLVQIQQFFYRYVCDNNQCVLDYSQETILHRNP